MTNNDSRALVQIGLSKRICNKLTFLNVFDPESICKYSEPELRTLGFSSRQIEAIEKFLGLARLYLAMPHSHAAESADSACVVVEQIILYKAQSELREAAETTVSDAIGELLEGSDVTVPGFGDDVFALPKRRKDGRLSDDERATRSPAKITMTAAGRPTVHHPRVIDLLDSITMTVEDAAFLLNRSKDAIYDALANNPTFLPAQRVGRSISVFSQPLLRRLGLK